MSSKALQASLWCSASICGQSGASWRTSPRSVRRSSATEPSWSGRGGKGRAGTDLRAQGVGGLRGHVKALDRLHGLWGPKLKGKRSLRAALVPVEAVLQAWELQGVLEELTPESLSEPASHCAIDVCTSRTRGVKSWN